MRTKTGLAILIGALAAASGCSKQAPTGELRELRGAMAAMPSSSAVCRAFTQAEIASVVAEDVSAGESAGPLGSGCRWELRKRQDRSVMVQVVPRDYWEDGTHAPGGEALSGIAEKAFVGPWLDDQRAGALTEKGAVYVISPQREMSVALLTYVVGRVPAPAQ